MQRLAIINVLLTAAAISGCGGQADSKASAKGQNFLDNQGRIDVAKVEDKPEIIFPKAAHSTDESLNAFLQRFTEVCLAGEYDQYRLLVSRQIKPVSKQQFERTYRRVEYVEITKLRNLPKISELPYPLWLVASTVHVRLPTEEPVRHLQVLIFKEDDKWVMAPAPRALREALAASSQPTTQPATQSANQAKKTLPAQASSKKQ